MDDLISQTEAAQIRGVTRAAISDLIRRGKLNAVTVAGRPLLRRADVEGYAPEAGGWQKGRKRKVEATASKKTPTRKRGRKK